MPNDHKHTSSDSSLDARVDALCDQFESAWKRGERLRIEDLLGDFDASTRLTVLRDLLQVEVELRRNEGETFSQTEYDERFAEHQAAVAEVFAAQDSGNQETIAHTPSHAASGLHVRCPHCHNPIELVAEAELQSIDCPSCGHGFTISGGRALADGESPETEFAHFKLIERLGIGAFGSVWKAKDTKLDRIVAVKIPRKGQLTPKETESFLREARAAAQLKHPNIVSVHEIGREDERLFIVSDFVEGGSLADRLESGPLASHEAAELCVKLAEALEHAHEQGVIHRDLKPANILLDDAGNPQIADFGLAKREAGEIAMTMEGQIIGTPAYMSPEQALGEGHQAGARSDIYSLGAVLYELLTGEMPFRGNVRMLLKQVVEDEPPPLRRLNSNIPKDLETICLKCLEKYPGRRYQTAQELAGDLRRYLQDEPIQARPISAVERGWRWCKRKPIVAGLSVAVAALLLGIAIAGPFLAVREANLRQRAEENEEEAKAEQQIAQLSERKARDSEAKAVRSEEAMAQALEEEEKARQASEAVVKFISDAFAIPEGKGGHRGMELGELLQTAANRIPETFGEQPLVEARTWLVFGKAMLDNGGRNYDDYSYNRTDPAEVTPRQAFENAYAGFSEIHGENHAETLRALALLSAMPEGIYRAQRDWTKLKEVYASQRKLLGGDHDDTVNTLRLLIERLEGSEKAEYQQHLVEIEIAKGGEQSEKALQTQRQLVKQLFEAKNYPETARLCKTLLPLHERVLGPNHLLTLEVRCYYCMAADEANTTTALDEFLDSLNDSDRKRSRGEVYFLHLLAGRMAEKGTTQSLILLLPHFAQAIDENKMWDTVPRSFNDGRISSWRSTFPSDDLDAFNSEDLVEALSSHNRGFEEVLMLRQRVAELYKTYRPEEGLARAHVELPLGNLLLAEGKHSEAVEILKSALEMTNEPYDAVLEVAEADSKLSDFAADFQPTERRRDGDPMENMDHILKLHWDCSLTLSNAQAAAGSTPAVIEELEKLVRSIEELRPWSSSLVRAQSILGSLYAEKGQIDQALEIMNTLVDQYIQSEVENRRLDPSERSSGTYAPPVFKEALQQVSTALAANAEIDVLRSAFDSASSKVYESYPTIQLSDGLKLLASIASGTGQKGDHQEATRWLGIYLEKSVKQIAARPFDEPADADKDALSREFGLCNYASILILDRQHARAEEVLTPFINDDYKSRLVSRLTEWQRSNLVHYEMRIDYLLGFSHFLIGQVYLESSKSESAKKAFAQYLSVLNEDDYYQKSLQYQTALFFAGKITDRQYLDATKRYSKQLPLIWYHIGEYRRWSGDLSGAVDAYRESMNSGEVEGSTYSDAAKSFVRLRQLESN